MSQLRFRSMPSASDDGFDYAPSDDGQVFTVRFSALQVDVDAGKSKDLVAAATFSMVVPIDGGFGGADITFAVSGFAFASEGARGYSVLSVNGASTVQSFSENTDEEFTQELRFKAGPTEACHLSLTILADRSPSNPDAAATVRPASIDAQITPADPANS